MATQKVDLTHDTVVNVTTNKSLTEGIIYTIQARSGVVLITEQASAPTIGDIADHRLVPDRESAGAYKVKSGESLYAWSEYDKASLSITEAP